MENGIYPDISNEDYHGGPGISKSGLDMVQRSPLHYWAAYLDPEREPRKETKAFTIGSAVHKLILEPRLFSQDYAIVPDDAPRKPTSRQIEAKKPSDDTLYAIAWWEDFNAANEGKVIITPQDYMLANKVAVSVLNTRLAQTLLRNGAPEQSIYWTDKETGVLCKCRPDWLLEPNPNSAILDVKTTVDASPDGFMRSAYKYRYHVQAAWYLDGVEAATGLRPDSFMFLALEKEAPFAHAFYYATEEMIAVGRKEYRKALRTYAQCLESGKWPGYAPKLVPLDLPKWADATIVED